MKPKRPKDLVKPTADTLNMSEQMVQDVVSFYWASLQKTLSNLESASVRVNGLGVFKARHNRINVLRRKYESYLDGSAELEKMTFNKHSVKKLSEYKLEKLSELEEFMIQEAKRKEEVKQKRKEYVNSKNLEK